MLLVDEGRSYVGWKKGIWCHLVSDANVDELHAFARRLRLRKDWFQPSITFPHYDISERKAIQAVELGAIRMSSRELVRRAHYRYEEDSHAE